MLPIILVGGLLCAHLNNVRSFESCSESPCSESESGACSNYQPGNGCVQCLRNHFKFNADYPCVNCQDIFGDECLHCSDGIGCQQCVSNDYYRTLTTDSDSGLTFYYCEETPCSSDNVDSTHCLNCNNGECSQCMNGYFRIYDNEDTPVCLDCHDSDVTGTNCLHCSDFNGCQQCGIDSNSGMMPERESKINPNNGLIYYQCVLPGM